MGNDGFDLSFLTEETFKINSTLKSNGDFELLEETLTEDLLEDLCTEDYPDDCGIIYHLEEGRSTFCIRGIPVNNIRGFFSEAQYNDCDLAKKLKIRDFDPRDVLKFFPTDSIKSANLIIKQMVNKRFPYQEDVLCNLSDPGFSWWMDNGERDFRIYFKSHGIDREETLTRLGPIGDSRIIGGCFEQLLPLFNSLFTIDEFSCNEKFFILSTLESNDSFEAVRAIFSNGSFSQDIQSMMSDEIFDCLKDIANLRRFWIEIENVLVLSGNQNTLFH